MVRLPAFAPMGACGLCGVFTNRPRVSWKRRSASFSSSGSGCFSAMSDDLNDNDRDALARMLDEPFVDYWPELGRFIHNFSGVERILFYLVVKLSDASDEVGKAAFSGLRVDGAKDTINRILEAKGDETTMAALAPTFAQIGVIATVRNSIVHWGAESTSDGLLSHNFRIASAPSRRRSYAVSPTIMKTLTSDLETIQSRLVHVLYPDAFTPEAADRVHAWPWRYKPPQQSQSKKAPGTRGQRRERRRPQPSSEE